MLHDAYRFVKTAIASLAPQPEAAHRDIYGRPVEDGDEFFHPQKFKGIPVFDTQSIMRHYADLIAKLKTHVDIGDHRKTPCGIPMFKALFVDVIERYVEYAHMVPASEDHHHCHTGGLLQHSLEASIEALRWSKDHKHDLTGVMDIDQEIKPIIDYCAWLGAFVHDAGKLMRDISVDAVEIIHPLTKRPIKIEDPIPSWHPQRESLTDWARRHNISSYSVNFLRQRTHKRHNVDSAQILSPLLRGTPAQSYILSTSLHKEMYSELVRVLSGYTQSKDILSESIRMGDTLSVQKNVGIQYDVSRGYRSISTPTRIFRAMSIAVRDWDWNRNSSQGFVIGGDIYIRWSSSIDSIINAATEHDLGIPTDKKNVLNIMDSNGFLSLFDHQSPEDRIIKFTPGNFTIQNIRTILSGKKAVKWIELIRLRDRGICFPPELPTPKSIPGLFFLPKCNQMVIVNQEGIATNVDLDVLDSAGPKEAANQLENKDTTNAIKHENSSHHMIPEPPAPASNLASTREQPGTEQRGSQQTVKQRNAEKKGTPNKASKHENKAKQFAKAGAPNPSSGGRNDIVFKNAPKGPAHEETQLQTAGPKPSRTQHDNFQEPQDKSSIHSGKVRGSELLKSIIERKCPYIQYGKKVRLPIESLSKILGKDAKEIVSELDHSQELDKNLNQPTIKTVVETTENGQEECVQLTIRASMQFTYTPEAPALPSEQCDESLRSEKTESDDHPHALDVLLERRIPLYVEGKQVLLRIDAACSALSLSEQQLIDVLDKQGAIDPQTMNCQSARVFVQDGNDEPACIKLTTGASKDFLASSIKDQPSSEKQKANLSIKDIVKQDSIIIQDGTTYIDVGLLTRKHTLPLPAIKDVLVRHQASAHETSPRVQRLTIDKEERKVIRLSDEFAKSYLAVANDKRSELADIPEEWVFYINNAAPGSLLSYLSNQQSLSLVELDANDVRIEALQLHKIGINRRRLKMHAEKNGGRLEGTAIVFPLSVFITTTFDEVNYNG